MAKPRKHKGEYIRYTLREVEHKVFLGAVRLLSKKLREAGAFAGAGLDELEESVIDFIEIGLLKIEASGGGFSLSFFDSDIGKYIMVCEG